MKINIIFRNFSSIEDSFDNNELWNPSGSPVLINFIKYLDKKDDLQILLIDNNKFKKRYLIKKYRFKNIKNSIYLINKNFFLTNNTLLKIINYTILIFLIFYKSLKFRPDAHYVDNQNVFSGALLTLINKNVTLRLLGAWGINFELNNKGFFSSLRKLSYAFPFKNIICTNDGSNFEKILEKKIFSKKSSIHHLLNGSEFKNFKTFFLKNNNKKKMRILHFGRFDIDKGTHQFVKTVHSIINEKKNIEFLVFGFGNYFDYITKYIKRHKIQRFFKVLPKQNLTQIYKHMSSSDLYISTNLIGSLSNSSLEAIGYGMPSIFVSTLNKKNYTIEKKLNKKYFYFSEKNFEKNLKRLILKYYNNRFLLKKNSIELKSKFFKEIQNWNDRILKERDLILGK